MFDLQRLVIRFNRFFMFRGYVSYVYKYTVYMCEDY